jgi:hypothetical protein
LRTTQPDSSPGRIEQAAAFDGMTAVQSRQTSSFTHATPLTISVWIYPTSNSAGAILSCAENAATAELANDDPTQGKPGLDRATVSFSKTARSILLWSETGSSMRFVL